MLAIAYGCSIGGIATLVGTPTNLAFLKIYRETFPAAPEISFGAWVLYATPLFLALLMVEVADVIFAVDSVPAIFAGLALVFAVSYTNFIVPQLLLDPIPPACAGSDCAIARRRPSVATIVSL